MSVQFRRRKSFGQRIEGVIMSEDLRDFFYGMTFTLGVIGAYLAAVDIIVAVLEWL